MPTSFNILRGNTVTIANKPLTEGLMTIDTDKKKVSVDWDSNGTLERIGFSSGDVTANSNESGSNDLEGLSVGKKGYKVLPIDSDLVLDENDITLSDIIDNKADIDDYGVDLIAKRVMTNLTAPTKNTDPYIYRKTPTAKTDLVDMHKIVGASAVWNQLVQNGNFTDGTTNWSGYNGTISEVDNVCEFTVSRATASCNIYQNIDFSNHLNHVMFVSAYVTSPKASRPLILIGDEQMLFNPLEANKRTKISTIKKVDNDITTQRVGVYPNRNEILEVGDIVKFDNIYVVDLTVMFGSTVADYVYSLEQSEVGKGIAWLQSYGFFTEDYYAYQTNKIESVCVSEKKLGGKNLFDKANFKFVIGYIDGNGWSGNKTILNYPFDSLGNFWNSVILDISKLRNKSVTYSYFNTQAETYRGILDSDFNVLARIGNSAQNVGTIDLSQYPTAKYLALSFIKSEYNFDNAQIEIGSISTSYEPYSEPSTYPISSITLRGLFGVNNGKLTVDGDEYFANGNVTRKYEQRAYQSGDESLANAITDGTNTIVKLETPTTETTTPFVEIQSDNASAMGNSVTVNAEKGIMQNAVVTLTPIQDLHGYDSPWVGGGGKNKCDVNSGNNTVIARNLQAGTWTFSMKSTGACGFNLKENSNSGSVITSVASYTSNEGITFTLANACNVFINGFSLTTGKTFTELTSEFQIESGSTATSFAPYSNICPISGRNSLDITVNDNTETVNFGETVYGGTYDVNGGTSSIMAIVDLDNLNWSFITGNRWNTTDLQGIIKGVDYSAVPNLKAEQYKAFSNNQIYSDTSLIGICVSGQGSITVRNGSTTETPKGKIAYELATPTTINTPATTISLNKGNNTVTVDDNSTISFSYRMRDTFISTEEFVDYDVVQGNRDITIPIGHDSDYYQGFDLPELPTDNNTYLLTCTVTNGEPNITWERS